MILIFAIAVMIVWAAQDWKWAMVYNITLLPVIVLPFLNLGLFAMFFLPMLTIFFIVNRLLPSLGIADVVAVPFSIFFLLGLNLFGIMAFPLALGGIFIACKLTGILHHYDKEERTNFKNKTKILPIMTAAFIISVIVHVVSNIIFPGLFL